MKSWSEFSGGEPNDDVPHYIFSIDQEEFGCFVQFILRSGYNLSTKLNVVFNWQLTKFQCFFLGKRMTGELEIPEATITALSKAPNRLGKRMLTWLALQKSMSHNYNN